MLASSKMDEWSLLSELVITPGTMQGQILTGTIPTGIAKLTKLTHLDLGSNKLTGPVPWELGVMPRLTVSCAVSSLCLAGLVLLVLWTS